MSIPPLEQRKKLKRLIPVLVIVILITIINIGRSFFSKPNPAFSPLPETQTPAKKVKIDWSILKSQTLDNLELFKEIPPLEGKEGRENPFIPY